MELSEKYLQKITQDKNRHGSDHLKLKYSEIIRYGEYCKLEERDSWEQDSLSNTKGRTCDELIKMAKEDGIAELVCPNCKSPHIMVKPFNYVCHHCGQKFKQTNCD